MSDNGIIVEIIIIMKVVVIKMIMRLIVTILFNMIQLSENL